MDETQSLKENNMCVKDDAPLISKGLTICHCRAEWSNQTTPGFLHSTELQDELGLEVSLERKNSDFPNLQQTDNFFLECNGKSNIVTIVYAKEVLIRGQRRAMIRPLILYLLMIKWRAHIWVTYLDHTHPCSLKEKQSQKFKTRKRLSWNPIVIPFLFKWKVAAFSLAKIKYIVCMKAFNAQLNQKNYLAPE